MSVPIYIPGYGTHHAGVSGLGPTNVSKDMKIKPWLFGKTRSFCVEIHADFDNKKRLVDLSDKDIKTQIRARLRDKNVRISSAKLRAEAKLFRTEIAKKYSLTELSQPIITEKSKTTFNAAEKHRFRLILQANPGQNLLQLHRADVKAQIKRAGSRVGVRLSESLLNNLVDKAIGLIKDRSTEDWINKEVDRNAGTSKILPPPGVLPSSADKPSRELGDLDARDSSQGGDKSAFRREQSPRQGSNKHEKVLKGTRKPDRPKRKPVNPERNKAFIKKQGANKEAMRGLGKDGEVSDAWLKEAI